MKGVCSKHNTRRNNRHRCRLCQNEKAQLKRSTSLFSDGWTPSKAYKDNKMARWFAVQQKISKGKGLNIKDRVKPMTQKLALSHLISLSKHRNLIY